MKVGVTAQGKTLDAGVDPRFGRCTNFMVVDSETSEFVCHDNVQNVNAVQGAGIQAARQVIGYGVSALITGNVGPKAFSTLKTGGVKVYLCKQGSVKEALQSWKTGQLKEVNKANVDGHWG